ncbi:HGxxPAAW family protein [Streptomyces sp. NPDC101393]|uniref:HGxxPAAW family protein n=1 Tax=Streptomyces sp. NPDC101393 TaxID=3366141 RepID=UPI0037FB20C8
MSAHGDADLGHTVAGWTGTAAALLGTTCIGVSLCAGRPAGILIGLAVCVVAALLTWALHLAGWGKPSGPRPREQQPMRTRDLAAGNGHPGCLGCRMAGRIPPATKPFAAPEPSAAREEARGPEPADSAA